MSAAFYRARGFVIIAILRAAMQSPAEFTIRPNSVCNDGSWRWLLASLAVVGAAVGARFAMLGFWLIAPFILLELGAVALAFWRLARAGYTEKVVMRGDVVEVLHLQRGRDANWRFPRARVRVVLRAPRHRWYPRQLTLGCGREWVEIGACLSEAERAELAAAMRAGLRAG